MSGRLFILSGASGSGKSTLMQEVCKRVPGEIVAAPKYSTRQQRRGWDDILPVPEINADHYDIAYVLNKRRYGIRIAEVNQLLQAGKDGIVILSDFRVVRRVLKAFGENAVSLYLSSPVNRRRLIELQSTRHHLEPVRGGEVLLGRRFQRLRSAARLRNWGLVNSLIAEILTDWRDAVPEMDAVEVRIEKIRTLHIRYVDNLDLFHHVLLNYTTEEDLIRQFLALRHSHASGLPSTKTHPVLYVVAAPSGAGKGTLMEVLNTIGKDRIRIVTKVATRNPKPNDKRDGMIALGEGATIPPEFDFRWRFHEGEHYRGTEYGISSNEINEGFAAGSQQIVISNTGQFGEFRRRFGGHVVFLYLHATRARAEIEAYQYENCESIEEARQRIQELSAVHNEYINRIDHFSHVLLNTAYEEDMYDQMFRLIEVYQIA